MNWAFLGSVLMFLAVALGAFGAHGLKNRLSPEMLAVFETGVKYHIYHALALFIASRLEANAAGWAFFIGILVFSGSLYVLSMTGIKQLGMITPIGGLSFLVGWLLLARVALRGS